MNMNSNLIKKIFSFTSWLTSILVSLMVGFAMINRYIIVPNVPLLAVKIAGWIIIVMTVLNIISAFVQKK